MAINASPGQHKDRHEHARRSPRIRHHLKSRLGCDSCKRRKVKVCQKCDEQKPRCGNCIKFDIPCNASQTAPSRQTSSFMGNTHSVASEAIVRRGRGRPRKDWATVEIASVQTTASTSPKTLTAPNSASSDLNLSQENESTISTQDIEITLHYISQTAKSLIDAISLDDSIYKFYAFNVPKIGLKYGFVLDLIYAITAHHLAYSLRTENKKSNADVSSSSSSSAYHTAFAQQHFSLGLNEFLKVLPSLNNDNCQALYVSSILICYCTFAAGPGSSLDLLVCDLDQDSDGVSKDGNTHPVPWLPLIHGVRTIRSSIEPRILFSGLMKPLGPEYSTNTNDHSESQGSTRPNLPDKLGSYRLLQIGWESPLHELQGFIFASMTDSAKPYMPHTTSFASTASTTTETRSQAVYKAALHALQVLVPLYKATFPPLSSTSLFPTISANHQPLFSWLYTLKDDFVSYLHQREPLPLVILAYYTVLLRTMESSHWFMQGWSDHLRGIVRRLLRDSEWDKWLSWPEIWASMIN